jgi:hypothetical protein
MKDTTEPGIAVAVHTGVDWGKVENPILGRTTRPWDVEVEMGYGGVEWRVEVTW